MKDPFSSGNTSYNAFVNTLVSTCKTKKVAWGIEDSDFVPIDPVLANWNLAYPKTINSNTSSKADRNNRDAIRIDLTKVLRPFYRYRVVHNSKLDVADKASVGYIAPDPPVAPVGLPVNPPHVSTGPLGVRSVTIVTRDPDAPVKKRSLPDGVEFLEIFWCLSDTPPPLAKDYTNSIRVKKLKNNLSFLTTDTGKQLNVKVRWIGKNGQMSDFGDAEPYHIS